MISNVSVYVTAFMLLVDKIHGVLLDLDRPLQRDIT